jgi:uncharacterized repeat protein (TIGR04138 family)
MQEHEFSEVVSLIRREDSRFGKGAYVFVRQALDFTISRIEEAEPGRLTRHVKGQELLEGIRGYALDQYGPMAFTVLQEWNIRRCRDFGEIVFQLIEYGVLGKTDDDRIEDFSECYTFEAAFLGPFLPASRAGKAGRQSASTRE